MLPYGVFLQKIGVGLKNAAEAFPQVEVVYCLPSLYYQSYVGD